VLSRISPSVNLTSLSLAFGEGRLGIWLRELEKFFAQLSQAAFTAEPTVDAVNDPPSTGAFDRAESPSLKVTF